MRDCSNAGMHLSMAGNGGGFSGRAVHKHAVTAAFPEKLDAVAFKMTDKIDPLHEMEASGSRITVLFLRPSSANARLDSSTN